METPNLPVPARPDVIEKALPVAIPVPGKLIAEEVVKYRTEADKAVAVAQRAEIVDGDTAGRAADVLRAITASLRRLEEDRKKKTAPLDKQKATITGLYEVAKAQYTKAKAMLTDKVDVWRRAEEKRLTAEAEERRAERKAEAERLAAAQTELGDAEGADRILEEAAALPSAPEKVAAVGVYGGVLSSRNRNVGEITDRREFLRALTAAKDPLLVEILDAIEFPKSLLNKLAKAVHEGEAIAPVGFTAKRDDSSNVR
jgi:hypothetical protein